MKAVFLRLLTVLRPIAATTAPLSAADPQIQPDVVYGHKDGLALTFYVLRPAKPTGAGLLWVQSGGWYSHYADPKVFTVSGKAFLDKGYTLFIVRHGSAPKYTVPEAVGDLRLCVRFLHLKAKDYGVDPDRLGVFGASAGGHLSLMLGTTGDDGDPKAKEAVLRQSDRVAAVVAMRPPTDISTWVTAPPEEIKKLAILKPPLTFDAKLAPENSPLLKVTATTAPTLLIHGDKDTLVPIDHSKKMLAALETAKVPCKLVVLEGAGHGFPPKQMAEIVLPAMLEWFDKHLAEKKDKGGR